ncbi:TIGR03084 family metal-binding protein [Rhodococcus ruber]|uniref:TIGR03084 family metal-binding protein n=1 Tax=Rhodococcus ruber TaxID=1830 RepID=UPI000A30C253|nr:TIGR03084 family metal-binding protein [Rhodococcus ruber]
MGAPLPALLADLDAENEALDEVVRDLSRRAWGYPTPAPKWTIAHQIAHLTWTDSVLTTAIRQPDEFAVLAGQFEEDGGTVDRAAEELASQAPDDLLQSWRRQRANVITALTEVPTGERIPWFGPPMGVAMAASARLMEVFAHGQDVRDALDIAPIPSFRLRHIAHLVAATRDFAFRVHRLPVPLEPFRIELSLGDDVWTSGPDDAHQRVTGEALDFSLLATRRRHRNDCRVTARGELANLWLDIIQAYAGEPGRGRRATTT